MIRRKHQIAAEPVSKGELDFEIGEDARQKQFLSKYKSFEYRGTECNRFFTLQTVGTSQLISMGSIHFFSNLHRA